MAKNSFIGTDFLKPILSEKSEVCNLSRGTNPAEGVD